MVWDFSGPPPSDLGDREVPLEGNHLQGKRVALLITGGIAAMKAPFIARALRRQGAQVIAFVSKAGLRYVTAETLAWSTNNRVITHLTPGAEHLSDDNPFHLYLVAPATYNTINKFSHGIADGVITSTLASALGRLEMGKSKILIVPTMHGSLHNSILIQSLNILHQKGVEIMKPRQDYGKDNIPDEKDITVEVCRFISESYLKNKPILVTGGPTPVEIDNIRRLTNIFTGQLGIYIAEELYLKGADVRLIHGSSICSPPAYLPHKIINSYDDYYREIIALLGNTKVGIFSAAVADYRPAEVFKGKIPSGGAFNNISLIPTVKVIEKVRESFPDLYMITFKYQDDITHEELMNIARKRLQKYQVVIANRGEEKGDKGEQIAYLVCQQEPVEKFTGKRSIARGIVHHLEKYSHSIFSPR
ncbi:MAG: Coenzyme A biosynthesis bifunctional protein CoaBC [Chroococcopsis gigantea SAG 12.99]|jgi:phosphopantothenoylcysteine decarboxylase/phosphopantothenate--cysteine ligase|nr:bifunctional phosphopantothenoylcysteine decarboxylase/phosphopantothenate--cysteine ligase CoaBC [Chlorogloea purpurea SAG 13.99]MDV3002327.1 Coenzyme A biosynthesis bifunctional protein CoaBC [Chroococcopsis gigantea SAG 12.99]